MAVAPEVVRFPAEPGSATRAPMRRPGPFTRPARLAAVLLLLVWVGPVTFAQTDAWRVLRWIGAPSRAAAEPRVIPAGMALELKAGTTLELHLRDGSVLKGRYLGRALLDSASYTPRFAARAQGSAYVPFALGETLHISLHDGREWSAPFAGYGELALLVRGPGEPEYRRVPFESARDVRRGDGERVEPGTLAREFRAGSLPSAEALDLWDLGSPGSAPGTWSPRRVAVEDIQWASVEVPSPPSAGAGSPKTGTVIGIVVLSVIVSVVLVFYLIGKSLENSTSSCRSVPIRSGSRLLSGLPRTTRPFDRDRGCYLGEPLAVADPGPGASVSGPTAALPSPATSLVPAPP